MTDDVVTECNYHGIGYDTMYSMDEIVVDGIMYAKSTTQVQNPIFEIKDDEDAHSANSSTEFRWQPDIFMSDRHWMSCKVTIPEHSLCPICGERDMP